MPKATKRPAYLQHDLDRFDRMILRVLQKDNKTPQREIAEQVNLSAAAVQRRIAAMESSGIITGNVALVDPHKVAATITAIVDVHLRDERATTVDRIKDMFSNVPEVQQCYYVTGGVSLVLIIVASDMPAYERLTRMLFAENEMVDRYATYIVLDRVKTDTAIAIP